MYRKAIIFSVLFLCLSAGYYNFAIYKEVTKLNNVSTFISITNNKGSSHLLDYLFYVPVVNFSMLSVNCQDKNAIPCLSLEIHDFNQDSTLLSIDWKTNWYDKPKSTNRNDKIEVLFYFVDSTNYKVDVRDVPYVENGMRNEYPCNITISNNEVFLLEKPLAYIVVVFNDDLLKYDVSNNFTNYFIDLLPVLRNQKTNTMLRGYFLDTFMRKAILN